MTLPMKLDEVDLPITDLQKADTLALLTLLESVAELVRNHTPRQDHLKWIQIFANLLDVSDLDLSELPDELIPEMMFSSDEAFMD